MRSVKRGRGAMWWVAAGIAGAVLGFVVGALIVGTVDPNGAYTDDDYRDGANVGYVFRYMLLGAGAAVLLRWVVRLRRAGKAATLPAIVLALVAAAAILPPALHRKSPSEQRRAKATAVEDPQARSAALRKAGFIDGCIKNSRREAEKQGVKSFDSEGYCGCLYTKLTAGPEDDQRQLDAMVEAANAGKPLRRHVEAAESCGEQALG